MSDNTSSTNNSENNIPQKQKINYSTDYMVELLKVSEKAPTNIK
jgi:hypothetical protein